MCSQRVINPQPSLLICRLRSSRASALPSPGCSRAPGRNLPDGPLPSKLWCPRECSRGPVQSIKRISSFFCLLYWVTVFSLELIFIVSDHRHVRGIAVTFAPPPNFTAEAATAQRGLSRPQRGKRWLHWGGDPGRLSPRHVLLWPLRLRAASLGSVLPPAPGLYPLSPTTGLSQQRDLAGPDHDLHRSTACQWRRKRPSPLFHGLFRGCQKAWVRSKCAAREWTSGKTDQHQPSEQQIRSCDSTCIWKGYTDIWHCLEISRKMN